MVQGVALSWAVIQPPPPPTSPLTFDKDGGVSRQKLDPCAARISRGVPSLDYPDFSALTPTRDDVESFIYIYSRGGIILLVRSKTLTNLIYRRFEIEATTYRVPFERSSIVFSRLLYICVHSIILVESFQKFCMLFRERTFDNGEYFFYFGI